METKECPWCRRRFVRPLSKNPVYCDRLCEKEAQGLHMPRCAQCAKRFTLDDTMRIGALRRYCSYECIKLSYKPPKASTNHVGKLAKWSRAVLDRDGRHCMRVGCTTPYRGVSAHHIRSKGAWPEFRYDVSNGIALCENCHGWATDNPEAASKEGLVIRRKDVA